VKAVLLLATLILVSGCIGQTSGGPTVSNGDTVSAYYKLSVDGAEIQSNYGQQAFSFTVGSGQVIPGFDKNVLGMKAGEEKTFTVLPKDGYGETGTHELAGKTLVFTVKIASITPAKK